MFEILGFEEINFVNAETGESVSGVKFYLSQGPIDEGKGKGYSFISKFFPTNKIKGELDVGKYAEFDISYNSKCEPKITGIKIS